MISRQGPVGTRLIFRTVFVSVEYALYRKLLRMRRSSLGCHVRAARQEEACRMLVVLVSISDEATAVNEFSVAKNLQGIQCPRRGRALVLQRSPRRLPGHLIKSGGGGGSRREEGVEGS